MFISKFMLNRQKILNNWQIHQFIESHFPGREVKAGCDYLYRLEWYKIGVVIPVLVYSRLRPEMRVCKEFQLIECEEKQQLFDHRIKNAEFSLFLVPDERSDFDPAEDFDKITSELNKKLKGLAKLEDIAQGPNNCIYYDVDETGFFQQTITLNGSIQIKDPEGLQEKIMEGFGRRPELGCGLLLIKQS
ncbi:MAG: type I-E CRISPR-associated protein Cas6/Cse3/CasE [Candidatus Rifleibacteriota bacterium]